MRRLLVAYAVNELGTWFGYVALAVGVYDHTHSAIATAALFIARGILPALLAPLLVVRVERSGRRSALAGLYVAEGLLTLALALLLWRFWLPGVLILVAVDGVAAVAGTAVVRATGARIAESEESDEVAQQRASASLNIVFMLSYAVGPAIGGLLVAVIGGPLALAVDAASFAACAAILIGLTTAVAEDEEGGSAWSQLADALRHVRSIPALRSLLLIEAVSFVFFASVEPIEVIYAKVTLSAGTGGLGILLAAWGVGAALGSILFARSLRRPLRWSLTLGTLCIGVAYLGFASAPTIALACVVAVIGGVGNGTQWPAFVSSVQKLTPPELQGRLMAVIGSMGVLCPSIGFALGGAITAASSTRVAMLVAGVAATVATAGFARTFATGASSNAVQSSPAEP